MGYSNLSNHIIRPPSSEQDWQFLIKLYETAFPDWEREPSENLRHSSREYKRDVSILKDGETVEGLSVVDYIYSQDYALFSYLAIQNDKQGKGYGSTLCLDAISRFKSDNNVSILLIEAEDRQAKLYNKLGFSYLPLDYNIPKYGSSDFVKMNLLSIPDLNMADQSDVSFLKRCTSHNFSFGYGLSKGDPRYVKQMNSFKKFEVD
jgi:ribosomal protein S18 acetylase RimI-like enzyme